jgi:hypothetical protein
MQILFETLGLIGMTLVVLIGRKPATRTPTSAFSRRFSLALRRPWTVFALIGILGFGASALVTVFSGIPEPRIHDEFSYLLAADTFAHGRVTNPSHPLWKYFETFHVIQQPTYASKYPPAQGLVLAFGQVFYGHPIVGVWLSVGLAGAAICWMLAGWCPLRWAWFGGLVAVVRLVFSGPAFLGDLESTAYWSQSYWGGNVAALGGALLFGALPRIVKKQRRRDALWLALGLAILANSRPFEGLVVSIPVMVVLGMWITKTRDICWLTLLHRVVLPLAVLLLITTMLIGYYNFQVSGHPLLMPYQVHESAYGMVPIFLWQPLKPEPHYNHQLLIDLHKEWSGEWYLSQQSLDGWLKMSLWKITALWMFFIGILFTPCMTALPHMWRRRSVKFALSVVACMMAAILVETWFLPHYSAPITCLFILLVVESLRQVRLAKWRGNPVGKSVLRAILPTFCISAIALFAVSKYLTPPGWPLERAQILQELEGSQKRHLILVRYDKNHSPHYQWIYNKADIDDAKVVWAWETRPEADKELLNYFKERRVWLLRVDQIPLHLTPYPNEESSVPDLSPFGSNGATR